MDVLDKTVTALQSQIPQIRLRSPLLASLLSFASRDAGFSEISRELQQFRCSARNRLGKSAVHLFCPPAELRLIGTVPARWVESSPTRAWTRPMKLRERRSKRWMRRYRARFSAGASTSRIARFHSGHQLGVRRSHFKSRSRRSVPIAACRVPRCT